MPVVRPASCSSEVLKSSFYTTYPKTTNARLSVDRRRNFSTGRALRGHYETLGVSKNASKNQIKSCYFKLSKMFHPDRTSDPMAKDKFHKISEAYTVLGDDRQRRAYDRTLASPASQATHGRHTAPSPSAYDYGQWGYETRRRGATHAWDHARRHRPPPGSSYSPGAQGAGRPYANPRTDPFSSPNVRRATGAKRGPEHTTDSDRVARVSGLWRAVQVFGLVVVMGTLGGWSANAA